MERLCVLKALKRWCEMKFKEKLNSTWEKLKAKLHKREKPEIIKEENQEAAAFEAGEILIPGDQSRTTEEYAQWQQNNLPEQ